MQRCGILTSHLLSTVSEERRIEEKVKVALVRFFSSVLDQGITIESCVSDTRGMFLSLIYCVVSVPGFDFQCMVLYAVYCILDCIIALLNHVPTTYRQDSSISRRTRPDLT